MLSKNSQAILRVTKRRAYNKLSYELKSDWKNFWYQLHIDYKYRRLLHKIFRQIKVYGIAKLTTAELSKTFPGVNLRLSIYIDSPDLDKSQRSNMDKMILNRESMSSLLDFFLEFCQNSGLVVTHAWEGCNYNNNPTNWICEGLLFQLAAD